MDKEKKNERTQRELEKIISQPAVVKKKVKERERD